jgi:lysophospholipase L1-like esterase
MVPVSGRTNPLNAMSNGTDIAQNNRFYMPLVAGIQQISAVYANWYLSTAAGDSADGTPVEVKGANDIMVSAAITTPDGKIHQLTVLGQTRWTIKPNGQVSTDPIDVDIKASAGSFYVRTYVEVAGGGKFPLGRFAHDNGDGTQNYTASPVDNTLSTSGSGMTTGGNGYSPVAVLGTFEPSMTKPIVALWGDSITLGTGDTDTSLGFAAQALIRDKIPFIKLARGAERAKNVSPDPTRRARRFPLAGGCTKAAIFYGTNDYNAGGDTAEVTEANLVAFWRASADRGMKALAATFTPRTTSTDAWATTTNQTPAAGGAARTAINDWIRDGAPLDATTLAPVAVGSAGVRAGSATHPLLGWLELADIVESARNSNIWKANYTTDGVHPAPAARPHGSGIRHCSAALVVSGVRRPRRGKRPPHRHTGLLNPAMNRPRHDENRKKIDRHEENR